MIQEQVINKILSTKNNSLVVLNNLNDSYFSDYKNEFNYIEEHVKQYGCVPDKETFISVFPNFQLIQVEENDSYLLEELFKDYRTHELASTFNKVRQYLLDGKDKEALSLYTDSSNKIAVAGTSLNCVSLIKDTSRYNLYLDKINGLQNYYIPTGFKELDDIIGGWDKNEELATIIARSNQGKSWILLVCATAALKAGYNVGLYSGEMSAIKVGYRFDTIVSHISNGSLLHGNENIESKYSKYIQDLPNQFTGDIKILTPQMINGPAGVNALRAFIEKEHLDILFIDQHSLLEDDRNAKNPVERAANISKDLKNLQVMEGKPIISVSQINREKNEDGSDYLDLAQISQSDRIGQDSTTVIGLVRDKKDKTLLKMQLVKLRDSAGVGQTLSYIVDFNTATFTFVPETIDETADDDEKLENKYEESGKDEEN